MIHAYKYCDNCGCIHTLRNPVNTHVFDLTRYGDNYAHTTQKIDLCCECFNKYVQPLVNVLVRAEGD